MMRRFLAIWATSTKLLGAQGDTTDSSPGGQVLSKARESLFVVLIALIAQCMISACEIGLGKVDSPFPPAIAAMLLVFMGFFIVGLVWAGLDDFYGKYIQPAVSCAI